MILCTEHYYMLHSYKKQEPLNVKNANMHYLYYMVLMALYGNLLEVAMQQ